MNKPPHTNSHTARTRPVSRRLVVPRRTEYQLETKAVDSLWHIEEEKPHTRVMHQNTATTKHHVTDHSFTKPYAHKPLVQKSARKEQPRVVGTTLHKQLARTAQRTDVLQRSLTLHATKPKRRSVLWQRATNRVVLASFAAVLVALTGYVSIDTWLTNRKIETQYVHAASGSQKTSEAPAQSGEGRDESSLPKNTLASYKVAADQPRALYINKIKVAARLMSMGVNKDGSLQAPKNIFDAGWYSGSAKPSSGGAVVVDAHASGPTREGLFAYLDTLNEGDIVTIETGNMTKYNYKVTSKEVVDRTKVDMQKLMLPSGSAIQGANFITCSGKWQQKEETFSQRTIIYSELIK